MTMATTRTATPTAHIWLDELGRAWIDDTNVKVIEVVERFLARREPPEVMQREYPHLALAQLHAALCYYYDHQAEIDADLERGWQAYRAALASRGESPTLQKARPLGLRP